MEERGRVRCALARASQPAGLSPVRQPPVLWWVMKRARERENGARVRRATLAATTPTPARSSPSQRARIMARWRPRRCRRRRPSHRQAPVSARVGAPAGRSPPARAATAVGRSTVHIPRMGREHPGRDPQQKGPLPIVEPRETEHRDQRGLATATDTATPATEGPRQRQRHRPRPRSGSRAGRDRWVQNVGAQDSEASTGGLRCSPLLLARAGNVARFRSTCASCGSSIGAGARGRAGDRFPSGAASVEWLVLLWAGGRIFASPPPAPKAPFGLRCRPWSRRKGASWLVAPPPVRRRRWAPAPCSHAARALSVAGTEPGPRGSLTARSARQPAHHQRRRRVAPSTAQAPGNRLDGGCVPHSGQLGSSSRNFDHSVHSSACACPPAPGDFHEQRCAAYPTPHVPDARPRKLVGRCAVYARRPFLRDGGAVTTIPAS